MIEVRSAVAHLADNDFMDRLVLVRTCYNYADEFDVEGMFLISAKNLFNDVVRVEEYFDNSGGSPITIYFGTNENIYIESFEDFENGVFVKEFDSIEDAEIFQKYLGRSAGTVIWVPDQI